jgi:hypothetical protein
MSHTPVAPVEAGDSTMAARIAVGAAVLFAAAMFWTVASVNVPHDPTENELVECWQQGGNRMSGVVSGVFALCAAALFALLMSHVLQLDATRRSPTWRAFARTMASAFTAAMLITAATRSAIGHLVDVMGEPLPAADTLRYATALNYQVLGLAAMGALSLTILAASVLALRTGAYARWVAWVGLACGSVMLAAAAAGYGGFTVPLAILWSVTLGMTLWPRSR